jgi:hypothetical protein
MKIYFSFNKCLSCWISCPVLMHRNHHVTVVFSSFRTWSRLGHVQYTGQKTTEESIEYLLISWRVHFTLLFTLVTFLNGVFHDNYQGSKVVLNDRYFLKRGVGRVIQNLLSRRCFVIYIKLFNDILKAPIFMGVFIKNLHAAVNLLQRRVNL